MTGLRLMYDNQLDLESMAYHRARDALDQLTKDVKNTRLERIRVQEQIDCDVIASIHMTSSPRKLKPIAKVIPLAMHGFRKKETNYTGIFHSRTHGTEGSNNN